MDDLDSKKMLTNTCNLSTSPTYYAKTFVNWTNRTEVRSTRVHNSIVELDRHGTTKTDSQCKPASLHGRWSCAIPRTERRSLSDPKLSLWAIHDRDDACLCQRITTTRRRRSTLFGKPGKWTTFFVGLEPATILSIYFMHIEKVPHRQTCKKPEKKPIYTLHWLDLTWLDLKL